MFYGRTSNVVFCYKEEWIYVMCRKIDGVRNDRVNWSNLELDRRDKGFVFFFMCELWKGGKVMGIESRLLVISLRGFWEGLRFMEDRLNILIFYYFSVFFC